MRLAKVTRANLARNAAKTRKTHRKGPTKAKKEVKMKKQARKRFLTTKAAQTKTKARMEAKASLPHPLDVAKHRPAKAVRGIAEEVPLAKAVLVVVARAQLGHQWCRDRVLRKILHRLLQRSRQGRAGHLLRQWEDRVGGEAAISSSNKRRLREQQRQRGRRRGAQLVRMPGALVARLVVEFPRKYQRAISYHHGHHSSFE